MNFIKLFNDISFEWIDHQAGSTLGENCAYLVPRSPQDEKIAFYGILNLAESFLDAGIGHFNPAYKTEKENGNYI